MDKITSILGAFKAGKMPTHHQICGMIQWLQTSGLTSVEPSQTGSTLSSQGQSLLNAVREILEAYKAFGEQKNKDDILQEAVYHLSCTDLATTEVTVPVNGAEVSSDAARLREALRTLLQVTWTHFTSGGESLVGDLASFARLSLADVAEVIQNNAAVAKEELRKLDEDVSRGERDGLGRTLEEREKAKSMDAKERWEAGMDTVKAAGSTVIDTSRGARETANSAAETTKSRLWEIYTKTSERAQTDPEYRRCLDTVFELVEKWLCKSVDAADASDDFTLESFIQDPTSEKHTITAVQLLRQFVERITGKSLDTLFSCLRQCVLDVRRDPELKAWFEKAYTFARQSLDEPGYATSPEAKARYQELIDEFKTLSKLDEEATPTEVSDSRDLIPVDGEALVEKKWKYDFAALRREAIYVWYNVRDDKEIARLHKAHLGIGKELVVIGPTILQQSSWIWGDMFQIYMPKLLALMKNVPIPRTEYKDSEVEFVLDNLDISSFNLLPSHVQIRNLTDVAIKATSAGTSTAVGTLTHVHIQAMQMSLHDVSFYYRDKLTAVGPKEITGILAFTLPQQGVDVDLKILGIPNTPEGLKKREGQRGFCVIEMLKVHISDDVGLEVRKTNHKIVMSLFRPFFIARFREAIERALEEQIRAVILTMDALAWSVAARSQTFADTGMSSGASYVVALYSELGRLQREGNLGISWKATGSGIITERDGIQFAMGAAPQIISGRKSGPMPGTYPIPVNEQVAAGENSVVGKAIQAVQNVKTFKETVDVKAAREGLREGWKSPAFDV